MTPLDRIGAALDFDKGPWTVGNVEDEPSDIFVESADFTNDVRLHISGDFPGYAAKREYAERLAQRLNAAPQASGVTRCADCHEPGATVCETCARLRCESVAQAAGMATGVADGR